MLIDKPKTNRVDFPFPSRQPDSTWKRIAGHPAFSEEPTGLLQAQLQSISPLEGKCHRVGETAACQQMCQQWAEIPHRLTNAELTWLSDRVGDRLVEFSLFIRSR